MMPTKPKEAIERMREWAGYEITSWGGIAHQAQIDKATILSYLDSIPDDAHACEWPKELTRRHLTKLCEDFPAVVDGPTMNAIRALRALAAIAPERKKRMVNLWHHYEANINTFTSATNAEDDARIRGGWRKVGGPVEIDE